MAYKSLGQIAPSATTETTIYSPSGVSTVVSTLLVVNRGATDATFRLAQRLSGEGSTSNKNYLTYDMTVGANDIFPLTLGICMSAGDTLTAYASTANLSFHAWGNEGVS